VRVRVPVYTGSSKHEFACISTVAVHIDTSSVRSVRVTCEFHSYEQFLCRSCFYQTRTAVQSKEHKMYKFNLYRAWRIPDVINCHC